MAATTRMASFAHEGLLLSLLVPDDWRAQEEAPNQVRFFGPAHSEHDDYQPTLSITVGEPDGSGDEWFERFSQAALEQLRSNYEGFDLLDVQRFTLSSLVPVNAVWYEWAPSDPPLEFSQLQALIPVGLGRMYLVNAATLRPLAGTYLPVFDRILRSIRILPDR